MGKSKKTTRLVIALLMALFIVGSCSPVKRHSRLVKRYPFVHQTDTVVLTDTIRLTVPIVQADTVMALDSFIISLHDTLIITKDNLKVKIMQVHDSIYIEAKCDTVFIDKIINRKVPIKYFENKEKFSIKEYISCVGLILLIIIVLLIIFKILNLLR